MTFSNNYIPIGCNDIHQFGKFFIYWSSARGYKTEINMDVVNNICDSVMFNNSGIVGIYEYFLYPNSAPSSRLATMQRCIRICGKHNEEEHAGLSPYHSSCFYMLGLFMVSDACLDKVIGDVFEFITNFIDVQYLYITVHPDDELSKSVWLKYVSDACIRINSESSDDNFWQTGDDGLAGFCSEVIFIKDNIEIELWNVVVIDRSISGGVSKSIPVQIDSGGGLERILMAHLYSIGSVNSSDLHIFNLLPYDNSSNKLSAIVLDCLLVIDAIVGSNIPIANNKRGYVLKKIIRKLIAFVDELDDSDKFSLVDLINNRAPFVVNKSNLLKLLSVEKRAYDLCVRAFYNYVRVKRKLDNDDVKKLYDTFGVHRATIFRLAAKCSIPVEVSEVVSDTSKNDVHAYQCFINSGCSTVFIYDCGRLVVYDYLILDCNYSVVYSVVVGADYIVVSPKTIFYPTSGGQQCDYGFMMLVDGDEPVLVVKDVFRKGDYIFHVCKCFGSFQVSESLVFVVDYERRVKLSITHSAHHIVLQLIKSISRSDTLMQVSSNISAGTAKLSLYCLDYDLSKIDISLLNSRIIRLLSKNILIKTVDNKLFRSVKNDYLYMRHETYPCYVRCVSISCDYESFSSKELCGGTHYAGINCVDVVRISSNNQYVSTVTFQVS